MRRSHFGIRRLSEWVRKRKIRIAVFLAVMIILFLPGAFQKDTYPEKAVASAVQLAAYYESGLVNAGSGFVFGNSSSEILIATCEHVVTGTPSRVLVFVDDQGYEAKVLCTSPEADVAVISVAGQFDIAPLALTEAGLFSRAYTVGFPCEGKNLDSLYYDEATGKTVESSRIMAFAGGLFTGTEKIYSETAGGEGLSGGLLVNAKGEAVGIVNSTLKGPMYALRSASTRELQKLCRENGIPYTHHVSMRLLRDCVAMVVFFSFIFFMTDYERIRKHGKEK